MIKPVMTSRFARRAAVVSASAAGLFVLMAAPAMAAVPEGWSDPEPVSMGLVFWLMFGIPVISAIVISLLVWLPGLVKGQSVTGGQFVPVDGPSSARKSAH